MKSRFVLAASAASALCVFAGEAAAQNDGEYPVRLVLRPQTVPARTIRFDGDFNVLGISACASTGFGSVCSSATATALNLGGAFGLTNDLEVGATIAPLSLSPNFAYNNPSLYGRFQFIHNNFLQLSVQAAVFIPVRDGSKFTFNLGVPLRYNFSEVFQLQSGVFYFNSVSDPISHGLNVPLAFVLNVTDNLHLGLLSGFGFNFRAPGDSLTIPLGVEGGFAVAGNNNRPMLDLVGSFTFPSFLVPGSAGDVVVTNTWTIGLGARFYLFM